MSSPASVLPVPAEPAAPNLKGLALIEALQRPSEIPRPDRVYVNRNLNLSQSAIFGTGVLTGQSAPTSFLSRSDFWAQGITFGLEIRF